MSHFAGDVYAVCFDCFQFWLNWIIAIDIFILFLASNSLTTILLTINSGLFLCLLCWITSYGICPSSVSIGLCFVVLLAHKVVHLYMKDSTRSLSENVLWLFGILFFFPFRPFLVKPLHGVVYYWRYFQLIIC